MGSRIRPLGGQSPQEQTQQKAKSLVLTVVSHLRPRLDTSSDWPVSYSLLHSVSAASELLCPPHYILFRRRMQLIKRDRRSDRSIVPSNFHRNSSVLLCRREPFSTPWTPTFHGNFCMCPFGQGVSSWGNQVSRQMIRNWRSRVRILKYRTGLTCVVKV